MYVLLVILALQRASLSPMVIYHAPFYLVFGLGHMASLS